MKGGVVLARTDAILPILGRIGLVPGWTIDVSSDTCLIARHSTGSHIGFDEGAIPRWDWDEGIEDWPLHRDPQIRGFVFQCGDVEMVARFFRDLSGVVEDELWVLGADQLPVAADRVDPASFQL